MGNLERKPTDSCLAKGYDPSMWIIERSTPLPELWRHRVTLQKVAVLPLNEVPSTQDMAIFELRYSSPHLVRVLHLAMDEGPNWCNSSGLAKLLVQYIPLRLKSVPELDLEEALTVLFTAYHGFSTIESFIGAVQINEELIGFTEEGRPKVWLSPEHHLNFSRGLQGTASGQASRVRAILGMVLAKVRDNPLAQEVKWELMNNALSYTDAIHILEGHSRQAELSLKRYIRTDIITRRIDGQGSHYHTRRSSAIQNYDNRSHKDHDNRSHKDHENRSHKAPYLAGSPQESALKIVEPNFPDSCRSLVLQSPRQPKNIDSTISFNMPSQPRNQLQSPMKIQHPTLLRNQSPNMPRTPQILFRSPNRHYQPIMVSKSPERSPLGQWRSIPKISFKGKEISEMSVLPVGGRPDRIAFSPNRGTQQVLEVKKKQEGCPTPRNIKLLFMNSPMSRAMPSQHIPLVQQLLPNSISMEQSSAKGRSKSSEIQQENRKQETTDYQQKEVQHKQQQEIGNTKTDKQDELEPKQYLSAHEYDSKNEENQKNKRNFDQEDDKGTQPARNNLEDSPIQECQALDRDEEIQVSGGFNEIQTGLACYANNEDEYASSSTGIQVVKPIIEDERLSMPLKFQSFGVGPGYSSLPVAVRDQGTQEYIDLQPTVNQSERQQQLNQSLNSSHFQHLQSGDLVQDKQSREEYQESEVQRIVLNDYQQREEVQRGNKMKTSILRSEASKGQFDPFYTNLTPVESKFQIVSNNDSGVEIPRLQHQTSTVGYLYPQYQLPKEPQLQSKIFAGGISPVRISSEYEGQTQRSEVHPVRVQSNRNASRTSRNTPFGDLNEDEDLLDVKFMQKSLDLRYKHSISKSKDVNNSDVSGKIDVVKLEAGLSQSISSRRQRPFSKEKPEISSHQNYGIKKSTSIQHHTNFNKELQPPSDKFLQSQSDYQKNNFYDFTMEHTQRSQFAPKYYENSNQGTNYQRANRPYINESSIPIKTREHELNSCFSQTLKAYRSLNKELSPNQGYENGFISSYEWKSPTPKTRRESRRDSENRLESRYEKYVKNRGLSKYRSQEKRISRGCEEAHSPQFGNKLPIQPIDISAISSGKKIGRDCGNRAIVSQYEIDSQVPTFRGQGRLSYDHLRSLLTK